MHNATVYTQQQNLPIPAERRAGTTVRVRSVVNVLINKERISRSLSLSRDARAECSEDADTSAVNGCGDSPEDKTADRANPTSRISMAQL